MRDRYKFACTACIYLLQPTSLYISIVWNTAIYIHICYLAVTVFNLKEELINQLYSSYTTLSCSWSELSTKRIWICIFSSSGKYRLIHLFLFCFWIGQFVKILTQNTHIWEFSYLSTSFSLVPKSDWYLIFNLDYCDKTLKELWSDKLRITKIKF